MKWFYNFLLFLCMVFSHTVKSVDYQQSHPHSADGLDNAVYLFCGSLNMTQAGMHHFLQKIYSDEQYASGYLAYDFSHLIQLLYHGCATKQPLAYMESIMRLFHNKIKETRYVSSDATLLLFEQLHKVFHECMEPVRPHISLEGIAKSIKATLYDTFLHKFTFFKQDPDHFFTDLSTTLVAKSVGSQLFHDYLQFKTVVGKFLENILFRVTWSALDQEQTWHTVQALSGHLVKFMQEGLLSAEDVDDLLRSLLESYCAFLSAARQQLSLQTVLAIKEDIQSPTCILTRWEEPEDCIATKKDRLLQLVMHLEASLRAREYGIIPGGTYKE